MITEKNRGPDQTYNEIPESMSGTNASKPWFSARPSPSGAKMVGAP